MNNLQNKLEKMASLLANFNDEDRRTIEDRIQSSARAKKRKTDDSKFNNITSGETANLNDEEKTLAILKYMIEVQDQITPKRNIGFHLYAEGEKASLDTAQASRVPLLLSDIQSFFLQCLLGNKSPCASRWCNVVNVSLVSHTVVAVFDGLSLEHFLQYKNNFTILDKMEFKLEVVTPSFYGGSLVEDLVTVALSSTERDFFIAKYGSMDVAIESRKDLMIMTKAVYPLNTKSSLTVNDYSISRTQLLLSPSQLLEESFPLPLKGDLGRAYADYVMTKDVYEPVHSNSPMFAIDCEMCLTVLGSELTKVSIVNEDHKIIYDTFVLPYNKIYNYLTRFSGITREKLLGISKRLEDVQQDLRSLLPSDCILIGQSLNSDFHALKIMHPYVIDTSVVFNVSGERRIKPKLKYLSKNLLNEEIQTSEIDGHCPVEDSLACMKLVQLKLNQSLLYEDAVLSNKRKMKTQNVENDIKQIEATPHFSTTIFNHMAQQKKSSMFVGCEDITGDYHQHLTLANDSLVSLSLSKKDRPKKVKLHTMESQDEVVEKMCTSSREHDFSMSHLKIDMNGNETSSEHLSEKINGWTSKIWDSLPQNSLFIVIFAGRQSENSLSFVKFKNS